MVWIEQVLLHDAEVGADEATSSSSPASTGGVDGSEDRCCYDEAVRVGKPMSRMGELEEEEGMGEEGRGRRMRRRQKSPGPHHDAAGGGFAMEELRL